MTTCHDIYSYDEPATGDRRIVVGVDASPASLAALRWAVDQARSSAARVQAVFVYQPDPYLTFAFGDYPAIAPVPLDHVRHEALNQLHSAVASAVPAEARPALELVLVADPSPAKALTRHAEGASMLVVGASRHHGLGVLLGSTATSCVRHATCPVVVVPTSDDLHDRDVVVVDERVPEPV